VNEAGGKLLELMQENELRAPHTYFKMKKNQQFATFFDNLHEQERPLMLDFFLMSQKLGNRIIDMKIFKPSGGPISDHHAVRMKLCLSNKMQGQEKLTSIGTKQLNDADTLMQY
jgi:hypothetical protein